MTLLTPWILTVSIEYDTEHVRLQPQWSHKKIQ